MLNKTVTTLIFSAFAGTVPLVTSPAIADFESGYLGARLGVFTSVFAAAELLSDKDRYGVNDLPLSRLDLVGGYGFMAGPSLYVGGEIAIVAINSLEDDILKESGFTLNLEGSDGFSLRTIAGYVPNPETLLYGAIGHQQRNYEFSLRDGGFRTDDDQDVSGIGFGFGLQQKIRFIALYREMRL